jgi:hypothetical protein
MEERETSLFLAFPLLLFHPCCCPGYHVNLILDVVSQAKSEEQLACEKEWLKAGHMWLAHRSGFTAVVREGDADAGRARIRVLQTGENITVDEDDLEKVRI